MVNYVDIAIGVVLSLAFLRGFAAGVWKAIANLVAVSLGAILAFFLVNPAATLLDTKFGVIMSISRWTRNVFSSMPIVSLPYDQSTLDTVFQSMNQSNWSQALKTYLQEHLAELTSLAGQTPTWGDVLAVSISRLFLLGLMFLVLWVLFSTVALLLARTFGMALPASLGARLLGGLVKLSLSAVWLSLLAGTLYPALTGGFLSFANDAAQNSWLLALLLGIYRSFWPFLLARMKS